MAGRNPKKKGSPRSKKKNLADPSQVLDAFSKAARQGRASSEDIAEELTNVFGGAKGLALLFKEIVFHSKTQPSTKVKVLSNMMTFIERTAKQYGDQARLKMMSKDQIEIIMCRMLVNHNFVMPIKGTVLNVKPIT